MARPDRGQQEARAGGNRGLGRVGQAPRNVGGRPRGGGAAQRHAAARSDVEGGDGVAVRGHRDDRRIRAVWVEEGSRNRRSRGHPGPLQDLRRLDLQGPPPQDRARAVASPYSQRTLTSAAASVWPKGLRTRQAYRAWSLRTGRAMSSWSPSARIRGGSAPSGSALSRMRPSRLQLSSPRPGPHPVQRSRSSAAPSSTSGASGCTNNWGRGSGRGGTGSGSSPLVCYVQDSRPWFPPRLTPRT